MVEKKEVTCPKCNYTWKTKSIMIFITCACCQTKFRKEKLKKGDKK